MRQGDSDAATKGVPHDEDLVVDLDGAKELRSPFSVTGHGAAGRKQRSGATKAWQRRCVHPTPSPDEHGQRARVGTVTQSPPVKEQHGLASAAHCIGGWHSSHVHPIEADTVSRPSHSPEGRVPTFPVR